MKEAEKRGLSGEEKGDEKEVVGRVHTTKDVREKEMGKVS